jgi:hypothetical protein
VSDRRGAQGRSSDGRSQGTTFASGSPTARSDGPDAEHERLERALQEMLAINRARAEEPSRYRRLAGMTTIIGVALVIVIIASVLALSHLSPKVVNGTSGSSPTSSSEPSTTTVPGQATIPPAGTTTGATAISALLVAGRDGSLTSLVGQGGQPIPLLRTPTSTFITNQTATPVVEFLWSARCGACGLENLVVATSLVELGGTFKDMAPMSFGPSFSSVEFSGTYRGPVVFEPVETIGPPGSSGAAPMPQARAQYAHYDVAPYAPVGAALPFLDIAGHYVSVGSDIPGNLVAGLTLNQIATALRSPRSMTAQSIIGGANILTAGICTTLAAIPKPLPLVCGSSVIQQLETLLPTSPPR